MTFGQGVIESDWVRLIEFIWRFISSSKQGFRTTTTDSQCSEVTFANREWVCFTMYMPSGNGNKLLSFKEVVIK